MRLHLPPERYGPGPSPPGGAPSQGGLPLGEVHPPLTTWMGAPDAPRGPLISTNRASLAVTEAHFEPFDLVGHPKQARTGRSRPATAPHRGCSAPLDAVRGGDQRCTGELGAPDGSRRASHTRDQQEHHPGEVPDRRARVSSGASRSVSGPLERHAVPLGGRDRHLHHRRGRPGGV